jgi:hypothetical protein
MATEADVLPGSVWEYKDTQVQVEVVKRNGNLGTWRVTSYPTYPLYDGKYWYTGNTVSSLVRNAYLVQDDPQEGELTDLDVMNYHVADSPVKRISRSRGDFIIHLEDAILIASSLKLKLVKDDE